VPGLAAESDCARAIAQAESALREISSVRRRSSELSSSVGQKAESAIPDFATMRGSKSYTQSYRSAAQFGLFDLRLVKAILDPLPLDPGLDFIVLDDGAIELTQTGFRRMVQAHSVELDTETTQLNETLGAPSARAMEKLFAAIDAEEAAAPRDQFGASAERHHWRRRQP
jgi:hypothetical protein